MFAALTDAAAALTGPRATTDGIAGGVGMPRASFESGPGELALTRAWSRVIPAIKGAGPVFVYPLADGTLMQLGIKGIQDLTYKPVIPKFDRSQEHHNWNDDNCVIEDLDPYAKPPAK